MGDMHVPVLFQKGEKADEMRSRHSQTAEGSGLVQLVDTLQHLFEGQTSVRRMDVVDIHLILS